MKNILAVLTAILMLGMFGITAAAPAATPNISDAILARLQVTYDKFNDLTLVEAAHEPVYDFTKVEIRITPSLMIVGGYKALAIDAVITSMKGYQYPEQLIILIDGKIYSSPIYSSFDNNIARKSLNYTYYERLRLLSTTAINLEMFKAIFNAINENKPIEYRLVTSFGNYDGVMDQEYKQAFLDVYAYAVSVSVPYLKLY